MHQSMNTYTPQADADKLGESARKIFQSTVNLPI